MDIAVIKLCAAMFGLNYDDLKQRHREQRMRRLAIMFGSIGAAVLAFAIFATVMLIKISAQNVTINKQYSELQDSFAASMAAASENLMKAGRKKDAVYAARSVLPEDGEGYNKKAFKALYDSMGMYKASDEYDPICSYDAGTSLYGFAVSKDQKKVLLDSGEIAYVCDADTGEVLHEISSANGWVHPVFCGENGVFWDDGKNSFYYSFDTGENAPVELPDEMTLDPMDDGTIVFVDAYMDNALYAVGENGEILFELDYYGIFEDDYVGFTDVFYKENELYCIFSDMESVYYLVKIDPTNGKIISKFRGEVLSYPAVNILDDVLYVGSSGQKNEILYSEISAVDPETGDELWKIDLEDFEANNGYFLKSDEYLFLWSKYEIAVLNPKTGEVVNRFYTQQQPIEAWIEDGMLTYVGAEGGIFFCSSFIGFFGSSLTNSTLSSISWMVFRSLFCFEKNNSDFFYYYKEYFSIFD